MSLRSQDESQKLNGFQKLEEMNISGNHIQTPEGLMGLAWLPRIKSVYIANNPISVKDTSDIAINDIENGEVLGHISFNPYSVLQDSYGITVKDAPMNHQKKVFVAPNPFKIKIENGIDRLSNFKKYALRDEDIINMLNRRFSDSINTSDKDSSTIAGEEIHFISDTIEVEPMLDFDGTFITRYEKHSTFSYI